MLTTRLALISHGLVLSLYRAHLLGLPSRRFRRVAPARFRCRGAGRSARSNIDHRFQSSGGFAAARGVKKLQSDTLTLCIACNTQHKVHPMTRTRLRDLGIVVGELPTWPVQCHHRCARRLGWPHHADLRPAAHRPHRRHGDPATLRRNLPGSVLRRLSLLQRQRRDDWPALAGGIGATRRPDRHHQHASGRHRTRCARRLRGAPPSRRSVAAARRGRDLRRLA
jgi:hypothetical protein